MFIATFGAFVLFSHDNLFSFKLKILNFIAFVFSLIKIINKMTNYNNQNSNNSQNTIFKTKKLAVNHSEILLLGYYLKFVNCFLVLKNKS